MDGVIIVKNPKEPIYEEDVLVLKEELIFSRINDIDVDEGVSAQIRVFDKNSKSLITKENR